MLQQLSLQNFQAHRRLTIDLDPGVTTVIGPTDAGKSSVVRALRWLALNSPAGDGFVRKGRRGTTVRLQIDDKLVIRRRGGSRNEYALDDEEFRAFGSDVPVPITGVLRLGEINFAHQLDPPFWLAESSGEVSRQLNSIIDLGVIDDTLAASSAMVRRSAAEADVCRKRSQEARHRRDELKWVPAAAEAMLELRAVGQKQVDAAVRRGHLDGLILQAGNYALRQSQAATAVLVGSSAMVSARRLHKISNRRSGLKELINEIRIYKAKSEKEIPSIDSLGIAVGTARGFEQRRKKLSDMILRLRSAEKKVDDLTKDYHISAERLAERTEGLCPVCGGEMKGMPDGEGADVFEVQKSVHVET